MLDAMTRAAYDRAQSTPIVKLVQAAEREATGERHTFSCTADAAAEIARLALLPPIDYDRERKSAAERLEIRIDTLDAEVRKVRGDAAAELAGKDVVFPQREPWPEPIDGGELLDEIAGTFRRFVILPEHADTALALWCTFTYVSKVMYIAPILALVSPEKRCGKTTVIGLLTRLVDRPLGASNISPASVFRSVEKWQPTLLIDEGDTFVRDRDELRGVLNSGHTRETAFVLRTVGDEHEPRRFSTWGPKAIAIIGSLPDTLADRAITIELRRKLPSERTQKLRHGGDLEPLARRCLRFAIDHVAQITSAQPRIPEELHDRAGDNWEPLFAIADVAGGHWPSRARTAASVLSGATADGDSAKVELLRDIHGLLAERLVGRSAVGSAELVEMLIEDKESRWAEFSHGRALTQRQLARLLRPFGVVPTTVRLDAGKIVKGYRVEAFSDPMHRYLSGSEPLHRYSPESARVVTDLATATGGGMLRIKDPLHASTGAGCNGVTDENSHLGGEADGEEF